jgi:hypothetical protein
MQRSLPHDAEQDQGLGVCACPELLLGFDGVTCHAADLLKCTALHVKMCDVLVSI